LSVGRKIHRRDAEKSQRGRREKIQFFSLRPLCVLRVSAVNAVARHYSQYEKCLSGRGVRVWEVGEPAECGRVDEHVFSGFSVIHFDVRHDAGNKSVDVRVG
jgi:hypothetical protein